MSDAVRVTLDACVEGNPRKGWRDGEEPNDVWEAKVYDFADLDAAKAAVGALPDDDSMTTHVAIWATDDEGDYELWSMDRDGAGLGDESTVGWRVSLAALMPGRPDPEPEPYDPTAVPDAPPAFQELA